MRRTCANRARCKGRRIIIHGIIHEEENADEAYIMADEMALHTSVKDALP